MLRLIENAWTLVVNLGWVIVLGVVGLPYVLSEQPTKPLKAAAPVIKQVAREQPPKPAAQLAEVPKPVQKADIPRDRLFRIPDPEPVKEPVPADLGVAVRDGDGQPEEEVARGEEPKPVQVCVNGVYGNGSCIMPSLRYDGPPRDDPAPDPDNNHQMPETPVFSAARATNAELRHDLWELGCQMVWNKETSRYLDTKKMGPRPFDLERIFDQNWELTWRIAQVKKLRLGQPVETKMPPRPPEAGGRIGDPWRNFRTW